MADTTPSPLITGAQVWRFDDDISTDVLSPGAYALDSVQVRMRHVLESVNPSFASQVAAGHVVIARRNFGCGSSRETAAENLKELGVACVVAESFARIFMRNAIAVGLPVLVCAGVHDAFSEGDHAEIDLASGQVRNLESGVELNGDSLPEEMLEILTAGGILNVLRTRT